jgi:cell division protein FtsZ
VPLDDQDSTHRYKGEDNLRQLDTPAYERRSSPVRSNQDPSSESETDGDEGGDEGAEQPSAGESRSSNVRRLRADDREDRGDRSRSEDASDEDDDSDTPAFLRKMMD